MKAFIRHFNPDEEYYLDEGCYINELSNTVDDPDVSIARARVLPDETTRWHRLAGTVERYVILEGQGRVEIGDMPPTSVSMGDTVLIPAKCRQRICNTGSVDLVFLAICSPRFTQDAYESTEDDQTSFHSAK